MTSRRMCAAAFALTALTAAGAASAQDAGAGEDCAAYAGWEARGALKAAPAAYDLPVARVNIGRPVEAALSPVESVTFPVPPERWPEPGGYAGLIGLTAPVAGTYRVSLGEGAWVDMTDAEGALLPAAAFGHGPDCEGPVKVVEFVLSPGDYTIQISGAPRPAIALMASRVR